MAAKAVFHITAHGQEPSAYQLAGQARGQALGAPGYLCHAGLQLQTVRGKGALSGLVGSATTGDLHLVAMMVPIFPGT